MSTKSSKKTFMITVSRTDYDNSEWTVIHEIKATSEATLILTKAYKNILMHLYNDYDEEKAMITIKEKL